MMKDKSHIVMVFSLIIIFVIVSIIVDRMFQPESYGEHGHYRWNANSEIQSQKIVNQNVKACIECHDDIYQLHEKDAHYNVPCVDCHGPGNLHVAFHKGDSTGNITKAQSVMEKNFNFEGCLYCHRKLNARPSDFPQVDQAEHYKFLNVIDNKTKCIACHNPHEPIFLLTEVNQSRIHPIVYKCTECHDKKPKKSFKEIPDHPTIFECVDCHAELVKDFSERPHHNYVECRTCHLFHKTDETTGRIYKNGNAKFCLLCHEKKPFKDLKYPPKIEWPGHLGGTEMIAKRDEKICLNCHADQIHKMNLNVSTNPHSKNWSVEHKKFARVKADFCESCHSKNECSSCHSTNKPTSHNQGWLKLHSKAGLNNRTSCDFCHKTNSCISCHKLEMPHPKGFDENHKELVSQKGKTACLKCHKEEFCSDCH